MIKAVIKLIIYALLLVFGLLLSIYFIVEIKDNIIWLNGHIVYIEKGVVKL